MERLVAVLATELCHEGEGGEEVRQFAELLGIIEAICPWVTPIRLGLCTFPVRGPSRLLGGDAAVLAAVRMDLERAGFSVRLGIAPGLFAATLAAQRGVIVGQGDLDTFLAPIEVSVLERPDLTRLLPRLGVRTLGAFADLGAREVYARFGPDALSCHRVASGEDGELPGRRDPGIFRRLRAVGGGEDAASVQQGFDGGTDRLEQRAVVVATRLQQRFGPESVMVARPRGGRCPSDQGAFVPFGGLSPVASTTDPPWPAHLPAPAPTMVYADPYPAYLLDDGGAPVVVLRNGLLSEVPSTCVLGGGRPRSLATYGGPWPLVERWWVAQRRRARLQVVCSDGAALLLVFENRQWWLEAVYD